MGQQAPRRTYYTPALQVRKGGQQPVTTAYWFVNNRAPPGFFKTIERNQSVETPTGGDPYCHACGWKVHGKCLASLGRFASTPTVRKYLRPNNSVLLAVCRGRGWNTHSAGPVYTWFRFVQRTRAVHTQPRPNSAWPSAVGHVWGV